MLVFCLEFLNVIFQTHIMPCDKIIPLAHISLVTTAETVMLNIH